MTQNVDSDIPYARELVRLEAEKATGVLSLTYRGEKREVHMREGRVAFATTTVETERIGRLLVRSGDLEDKDVSEALAGIADGELIGEWLVNNERIGPPKLQWGLRQQCERLVCASFAWPAAELNFEAGERDPPGFQNFALPIINVVLEGSRRFLPPAMAIDVLNGIGERCELSDEHDEILRDVRIGPEEERVLGLLDGKRTAEEIARLTLLDTDDVYKITAGFALIGAIRVPGPKPIWDRSTDRIDVRVWDQDTDPEINRPRAPRPVSTDLAAEERTIPTEDATPIAIPDSIAVARDALPPGESVLTLDSEKATGAWRQQLDTATESLLVWFDGQRTLGDVLELLEGDEDSIQVVSRLVRDGYLSPATNGAAPVILTSTEELQRLKDMAPEPEPEADPEPEPEPAQPEITDEASLAQALLQQADRLVAAGARAVEAGNYGHAARFFQRALRKSPDHADALLGLGTSRYGMNDRSGARIAWESFLRIEPKSPLSDRIRNVLQEL